MCRDFPYELSCYTFGAPRVGNAAFVAAFGELVDSGWRVHRYHDLVPMLPPPWGIWGYRHVDVPVCPAALSPLNSRELCAGSSSFLCVHSYVSPEISRFLGGGRALH